MDISDRSEQGQEEADIKMQRRVQRKSTIKMSRGRRKPETKMWNRIPKGSPENLERETAVEEDKGQHYR
jgi:hypothetical protein